MQWNYFANLVSESGALQQRLKHSVGRVSSRLNTGKRATHLAECLPLSADLLLFCEKKEGQADKAGHVNSLHINFQKKLHLGWRGLGGHRIRAEEIECKKY